MTAIPYVLLQPYFPFGGDVHHAVNVAHIIEVGFPAKQPDHLDRIYPDNFAYLSALLAEGTDSDVLGFFKMFPILLLCASLASVYWFTSTVFGRTAGYFGVLCYGVLSFQPRHDLFAGTFIELLTTVTLMPLYLTALVKAIELPGYRWAILAGIFAGSIARYHFLATTIAACVTGVMCCGIFALRRDLITRRLVVAGAIVLAVCIIVGLPYTLNYASVYFDVTLSRLGFGNSEIYSATFPGVVFPQDFQAYLGDHYFKLSAIALVYFALTRLVFTRPTVGDVALMAWSMVLVLGALTSLFLVPTRILWLLPLPTAAALGAIFGDVLGSRPRILAGSIVLGVTCLGLVIGLGGVSRQALRVAAFSQFAEERDVAGFEALRHEWDRVGRPYVLTDASGWWVPYYVGGQSYVLPGGPASFTWYGAVEREQFMALWQLWEAPCSEEGLATLSAFRIGLVYIGRPARHWTPPGYAPNDGSKFLDCRNYNEIAGEAANPGLVRILSVVSTRPLDEMNRDHGDAPSGGAGEGGEELGVEQSNN